MSIDQYIHKIELEHQAKKRQHTKQSHARQKILQLQTKFDKKHNTDMGHIMPTSKGRKLKIVQQGNEQQIFPTMKLSNLSNVQQRSSFTEATTTPERKRNEPAGSNQEQGNQPRYCSPIVVPESFTQGRSISSAGNATVGMHPYSRGMVQGTLNGPRQSSPWGLSPNNRMQILSPKSLQQTLKDQGITVGTHRPKNR